MYFVKPPLFETLRSRGTARMEAGNVQSQCYPGLPRYRDKVLHEEARACLKWVSGPSATRPRLGSAPAPPSRAASGICICFTRARVLPFDMQMTHMNCIKKPRALLYEGMTSRMDQNNENRGRDFLCENMRDGPRDVN